MKVLSKLTAVILAVTLTFSTFSSVAFAKETSSAAGSIVDTNVIYSAKGAVSPCQVHNDREATIYHGIGRDQWIHISPWVTPAHYTIRMYESGSNKPIYTKAFTMTDATSHWYVGANVQRVTLQGTLGAVNVSSSDH